MTDTTDDLAPLMRAAYLAASKACEGKIPGALCWEPFRRKAEQLIAYQRQRVVAYLAHANAPRGPLDRYEAQKEQEAHDAYWSN
jgi:hypothetical protein